MPNQNPNPEPSAAARIAEALKDVDFKAVGFSMDTLYDKRFPNEVSRHEFRQACLAAMKKAEKPKPEAPAE